MNEDATTVETIEDAAPKRSSLARKALIVTGAVVGIIAAGVVGYVKTKVDTEECTLCDGTVETTPIEIAPAE